MKNATPPKVRKFPAAKQRRLDQLLEKNSEGAITPSEKAALERLVAEAEDFALENAKRMAKFAKQASGRVPSAVPVTVWVQPQASAKR